MANFTLDPDVVAELTAPQWVFGQPLPFWVTHHEFIWEIIKTLGLRPCSPEVLVRDDPVPIFKAAGARTRSTAKVVDTRPFPGGIRGPHLHHHGNVYLLTQQQWKKFSDETMNKVKDHLDHAGTVGFEQLVTLAESAHAIPLALLRDRVETKKSKAASRTVR